MQAKRVEDQLTKAAQLMDEVGRDLQPTYRDVGIPTKEIMRKVALRGQFGRKSYQPADFCYNMINEDPRSFEHHVFEQIRWGRFRYRGLHFPYTGPISWKGTQVGVWTNGTYQLWKDPRPRQVSSTDDVADLRIEKDIHEILLREIPATTKAALVSARIGQGAFRTEVLHLWGDRCAVTESKTKEAIRASHIQPWKESSDEERLDPHNGLPLVGNLDALFDAGLISFDRIGKMLISSKLNSAERAIFGFDESGKKSLRKKPSLKTAKYLTWHSANCFKK